MWKVYASQEPKEVCDGTGDAMTCMIHHDTFTGGICFDALPTDPVDYADEGRAVDSYTLTFFHLEAL